MGDAQAIVDGVLAKYPLAGLSLGVVTREGLTESVQRGVAGDDRAVELDTVFRIGSVTKTMTAGAYPALRKTAGWKNPRRAVRVAAAGAGIAVAARRISARRRRR